MRWVEVKWSEVNCELQATLFSEMARSEARIQGNLTIYNYTRASYMYIIYVGMSAKYNFGYIT